MTSSASTRLLNQAIIDDGIRSTHFFNGRLLSGEDLSLDQQAIRELRRRTGRALGDGVAFGLEVYEKVGVSTRSVPVVTVTAGLAVNRQGSTLLLGSDVDIQLVPPTSASSLTASVAFNPCQPGQTGSYVVGAGIYLLTILPAVTSEGRAPVSGLGNTDSSGCNARNDVEAIQFQLIGIDPINDLGMTPAQFADTAHLRNRLAYLCFGLNALPAFYSDPFGPPIEGYGLLDMLRLNRLPVCNVPLAMIYWTATDGIQFIDLWSVRRSLTAPSASLPGSPSESQRWNLLMSDRRLKEAEAMFLQFEDHMLDLRASVIDLQNVLARQVFDYLPPVGMLPVLSSTSPGGYDLRTFFGGSLSWDVSTIDSGLLRSLLHDASYYDPINLQTVEKIQVYIPYENLQAVNSGQSIQLAAVFASPSMPYRGIARFDIGRFDLSRFAPQPI